MRDWYSDLEKMRWVEGDVQRAGRSMAGRVMGCFLVRRKGCVLRMIVGQGEGWEHVSVSLEHRCPTWDEMCYVKSLFWRDTECVVQFHPPKADYVNVHPYCLHLWKPIGEDYQLPPSVFV